jgi:hypothetical protein
LVSLGRPPKLLAVLAHDRGGRLQPNADGTALIYEGALCGDPPETSSGVNIDAIAITSVCAIQKRTTPCLRSQMQTQRLGRKRL